MEASLNDTTMINSVVILNLSTPGRINPRISGTLRFATERCYYGDMTSKSLPVTSPPKLQYGFPASCSLVFWYRICRLIITYLGVRKSRHFFYPKTRLSRRESLTATQVVTSLEVILRSCRRSSTSP